MLLVPIVFHFNSHLPSHPSLRDGKKREKFNNIWMKLSERYIFLDIGHFSLLIFIFFIFVLFVYFSFVADADADGDGRCHAILLSRSWWLMTCLLPLVVYCFFPICGQKGNSLSMRWSKPLYCIQSHSATMLNMQQRHIKYCINYFRVMGENMWAGFSVQKVWPNDTHKKSKNKQQLINETFRFCETK